MRLKFGVLLGVVPLAAGTSAFAFASPTGGGDRLQNVRICGAQTLDRGAGECRRDQSGSAIRSSAFYCSASALARAGGERFSGRFLYRGQPFPAFGTGVGSTRKGVYVYLTAGPYPMPGGPWSCELRLGPERVRKSFRSGGPSGPILHLRACRTSRTVSIGPVRVCARDESATSFKATEPVVCSAVFVGGKGKLARIEFMYEGKRALDADFELPLPITASGPRLDPSPRLASGRWGCRWSVAGRVLGTKSFRIG
jgi:hypothetical protein